MIATVTLNPSLDRTVTVEELVLDEANRWTSLRRDPGGKGINVSRVIYELGGDTVAYGFIGGVEGETIKHLLSQQGVLYDFNPIKGEVRSNFIITDLKTHRQTRIDAPGPYVSGDELQNLVDKLVFIEPRPEILVFAGSVPPGIPDDIYKRLIETAKLNGVKTVLDSDSRLDLDRGDVQLVQQQRERPQGARRLAQLAVAQQQVVPRDSDDHRILAGQSFAQALFGRSKGLRDRGVSRRVDRGVLVGAEEMTQRTHQTRLAYGTPVHRRLRAELRSRHRSVPR